MKIRITLFIGIALGLAEGANAQPTKPVASNIPKALGAAETQNREPEVLMYADEMPAFPGGDAGFHRYLAQKINYPAEALRRNLSGTVYVRFVVDEEGRIRDVAVVKGCGNGFEEEALRLVRLMPWWSPGRVGGQPVRVARTLPIIFRVSSREVPGN